MARRKLGNAGSPPVGKAQFVKQFDQTALVELVLRQSRFIAEFLEASGVAEDSDKVREASAVVYAEAVKAGYVPDPNRFARPEHVRIQERQMRFFHSRGIRDPNDMNDCIRQIAEVGPDIDQASIDRITAVKYAEVLERTRPAPETVAEQDAEADELAEANAARETLSQQ